MRSLPASLVLAAGSLFAIIDPLATAPVAKMDDTAMSPLAYPCGPAQGRCRQSMLNGIRGFRVDVLSGRPRWVPPTQAI